MAFEDLQRQSIAIPVTLPAQITGQLHWVEVEIRYFAVDDSQLPVDIWFYRPQTDQEFFMQFQPWEGVVRWELRYRLHVQTPTAFSDPIEGTLV